MNDLVGFLKARLDEDERVAQFATSGNTGDWAARTVRRKPANDKEDR